MNKSQIKEILHDMSFLRPEEAEFLWDHLKMQPKKGKLLELGTGIADSTIFFAKALPEWKIYSVDAYGSAGEEPLMWGNHPGIVDEHGVAAVKEKIEKSGVKNVELIISSFEDLEWSKPIDALFIDGTHWYKWVKQDFEKFSPFVKKGGIIMFDDYNDNWGVKEYILENLAEDWEIASTDTTAVLWKKS